MGRSTPSSTHPHFCCALGQAFNYATGFDEGHNEITGISKFLYYDLSKSDAEPLRGTPNKKNEELRKYSELQCRSELLRSGLQLGRELDGLAGATSPLLIPCPPHPTSPCAFL